MKRYIATITPIVNSEGYQPFEIYYDAETGLLEMPDGSEIYDTGIIRAADKAIVEIVFGLYDGGCWKITDCIEYEED